MERERKAAVGRRNYKLWAIGLALGLLVRSGGAVPIRNLALPVPQRSSGAIQGTVVWKGHRLTNTTVYLYRDPALKDLYGGAPLLSESGAFHLSVDPGRYYLVAVVDRNGNGTFDGGDVLGIYGIRNWSNLREGKRSIEVPAGKRAVGVQVFISAIRVDDQEGNSRIVDLETVDPALLVDSEEEPTGEILGRVPIPPGLDLKATPAYVFAYTDLSWTKKVASGPVGADGRFRLALRPGRYYLGVVVDRNRTNLFDAGDLFGVNGVRIDPERKAPSAPEPLVLLAEDHLEGIEVPIFAVRTQEGRLRPLEAADLASSEETSTPPAVLLQGRVLGAAGEESFTVVEVYDSPALMFPVQSVPVNSDGSFQVTLAPGTYYLVANVDRDRDGRISPSDGVGAFGTDDLLTHPPQPLVLQGEEAHVEIRITARYDTQGQLRPWRSTSSSEPSSDRQGIQGRILWDGQRPAQAWLVVSTAPDFSGAPIYPVQLDRLGSFELPLDPGTYYLMAIVEGPGDDRVGIGDGIALYGTRDALSGTPQPVTVWPGQMTPNVFLYVTAIATDDQGGYAMLDDGQRTLIRRQYGEPNDRYRYTENGRTIEEWVYWLRGVSFRFVAEGPSWRLDRVDRFTPNREAIEQARPEMLELQPSSIAQSLVPAEVFYGLDHTIWALHPDGTQQPLAAGTDPIPTPNGLFFRDDNRNIVALDLTTGEVQIALPAELGVERVAPSPDGTVLAYVRDGKLRLRLWATGEERVPLLPVVEIGDLAWHRDGHVLAFAARDPKDSRSARNLYLYDAATDHWEPLIAESTDDYHPRWSPSDNERLVFVRTGETGPQIWLAHVVPSGTVAVERLTPRGGEDPSWLPDGSGIVYRVNGQIWTLDLETRTPRPLLVNGEPVLATEVTVSPRPLGH